MKLRSFVFSFGLARLIITLQLLLPIVALAGNVGITWNAPIDVPVTASSYTAAGNSVNFTLNCVPTANSLTVVRNTGPAFIQGTFGNLAQGQPVALSYAGVTYNFVANYYGGAGRDLVLVWAGTRVFATGANTYGQLGDSSKTQRNAPVPVSTAGAGILSGKTVIATAAGASHSLALCSDGTLAAWGYNYDGELGINSAAQSQVPVAVNTAAGVSALAGKTVVAVTAGEFHSLALCADGTIAAWGYNYDGELGNNSSADSLVPAAVNTTVGVSALAGKTVTAVASGQSHNLALCSDGTLAAWGFNADGELGNNSTTGSLVPVAVDRSGVLSGKTVVAIAAGSSHSLALCSDGTLVAWGDNTFGQLGTNSTTSSLLPVAVNTSAGVSAVAGKTVVSVAAGAYHSLALCSDGTVVAWGYNGEGQLGDNSTTQRLAPVAVSRTTGVSVLSGRTVVGIQAGQYHSVAQCTDGTVAVWGWNHSGQLGNNTTTQCNVPVAVNATTLAAGERLVMAGSGSNGSHTLSLAASVPPALPVIAVEQPAGNGLTNGGAVNYGSWVVGNPVPLTFSIRNKGTSTLTGLTITKDGGNSGDYVVTTSPVAPLAPGALTTCTVTFTPSAAGTRTAALHIASNDSQISSFTINLTGAGSLTGNVSAVFNGPTDVPITASSYTAAENTISITLNCVPNANELMVVKNTGTAFIQGAFSNLAQGQAVTLNYAGLTYSFVANYYGGSGNDLVLFWTGTRVFAWGANSNGQLGDNTTSQRTVPFNVTEAGILSGKTVVFLAAGSNHSLALCSDGTVAAWGQNTSGQLGDNTTTQGLVPVVVNAQAGSKLFGKTVVSISAGSIHSLALCSDGTVAAWGQNTSGQLGDNTTMQRLVPVAVNAQAGSALFGKTAVAVAACDTFSLALCSDGTVVAWGDNTYGQLGTNNTVNSLLPVAVNTAAGISALAGKTVMAISANRDHSLALCSDQTLVAWGNNGYGMLGTNNTTQSLVPVAVNTTAGISSLAGKTVVRIAAGITHSLALCSDGSMAAWGQNSNGQLGDNTTTQRLVPVAVNGQAGSALFGKTVVSVSAGAFHSLALCSDGTLAAWGYDFFGQLGDNATTQRLVPVAVDRSLLQPSERFSSLSVGLFHSLALVSWPARPIVTSLPATGISTTGGTLNGTVNANGNSPAVTFEYGITIAYGNTVAGTPGAVTGSSATPVSATIAGLIPGTIYHYRVNGDIVHGDDLTFTATRSSNPNLANLIISEGALSPAFGDASTNYTALVISAADSITITPTVTDYAMVTVNGVAVASGSTSAPIALAVGTNILTIVGTSQDGTAARTYTVTVTRPVETHTVAATWNSPTDIPATTSHYTATGNSVNFMLKCVPVANELMVIKNTGPAFIQGAFSNLAQGQAVELSYAGQTYNFVANYYGGNGRELVLVWAGTRVVAWGNNYHGDLGNNTTGSRDTPVSTIMTGVFAGKTVVALAAGEEHSLALCSDGTVFSWGYNNFGELGDNTTTDRLVPVAVNTAAGSALFGKTVVAIAGCGYHKLALCSDGTVAAWGFNNYGQLGNNNGSTNSSVPVAVNMAPASALFGKTVVAVAASDNVSLALCSDGTVVTWGGGGYGRLVPVAVNSAAGSALFGKTVVRIAVGDGFGLALCADGTVVTWPTGTLMPVAVNTASGSALFGKAVVGIAVGPSYSLALCSDGTVAAWGDNDVGQLGDNTNTKRLVPVAVDTAPESSLYGKNVVAIAAGTYKTSLALCSDGTVAAWGGGFLGNNTFTNSAGPPVQVDRSSLLPSERFSGVSTGYFFSLALVAPSVLPPAPICTNAGVINLTQTSVQLNGSVNAQGYDTTAAFEYGTNGITFPNTIDVTPPGLNGTGNVILATGLTGLQKGATYYYHLKATNRGGITISATQIFTTLTDPVATVGSATAVTSMSAQVNGSVNAMGTSSSVYFEYGTDGVNFPNSAGATPAVVNGNLTTAVRAVISSGLNQGTRYYYRVRAVSAGGVGVSSVATFSLDILSGFTQVFPGAPPEAQGFLIVNVTPSGIGGGWRFVGEQLWRAPGTAVGGLTSGDRQVEFRPVAGYHTPETELVSVVSGDAAAVFLGEYAEVSGSGGTGAMIVLLKPDSLTVPELPVAQRAQWRLLGEDDTAWRESGATLGGLRAGSYLVESKPLAGRTTPRPLTVNVGDGQTVTGVATYFLADAITGTAPGVLPFDTVIGSPALPYQYVGHFRNDAGSGSGFVVKPRVVATAAHMVFDDGTLSATTGQQWLFEHDRASFEPVPQVPRGFYMFAGYSAQRTLEATPGESSPASQTLDAAAVYFLADAGRGGFGGYLASDSTPNEWVTSAALKTLVGYPVDGISANNQGRMHATPPANVSFTHSFGRTYTTAQIRSSGGSSGGPLCVQFENGSYYPAAIYLGGTGQTVVRVIDSDVVDMFNRAEVSANGGDNNTGGGITHSFTPISGSTSGKGSIKVNILPDGAAVSARWKLSDSSTVLRTSGTTLAGKTPGGYALYFTDIAGYASPDNGSPVSISANTLTTTTATYKLLQTVSFSPPASRTLADPPLTLNATASSGLPVSLAFVSGPASLAGNVLTPTGIGTVTIVASQPGDATRAAATNVTATIQITADNMNAWQSRNFTVGELANAAISGPLADPNGNGVGNLLEFAFNMNPRAGGLLRLGHLTGSAGLPYAARNAGGYLAVEYIRRKPSGNPGISYAVEFAASAGGPWTVQSTESISAMDVTFERVTVTDPTAGAQRFGRVKVTTN